MIYLSGADNALWRAAAASEDIGLIASPDMCGSIRKVSMYRYWAADNACFAHAQDFDWVAFLRWLSALERLQETCLFVAAPDVVGDWAATLVRSMPALPILRAMGWVAAIVLQDGATPEQVPWGDCDAVFVGGTTRWKLGQQAESCCRTARTRGKWVHMGRVNSARRLAIARQFGCDSVDGTFVARGPRFNAPRMLAWLRDANAQMSLRFAQTGGEG
jgi:hypothetical protein